MTQAQFLKELTGRKLKAFVAITLNDGYNFTIEKADFLDYLKSGKVIDIDCDVLKDTIYLNRVEFEN